MAPAVSSLRKRKTPVISTPARSTNSVKKGVQKSECNPNDFGKIMATKRLTPPKTPGYVTRCWRANVYTHRGVPKLQIML